MGVLLPNYSEENVVPNFKINTSEGTSASNVFQILQDLRLKQYHEKCHPDSMQIESKMFHTGPHSTSNIIAQPVTSFRTTTSSTATTGRMTTKQVNPVHPDASHKAPLGHCMHVHQPAIHVCKPGELLALRKVKHPHNGRTSVNRLPSTKQDIVTIFRLL